MTLEVKIPDIGNYSNVDVIEILMKVGDKIALEDPLITLETDKAALEVPSPVAGVVKEVKVKVGDKVSEGSLIAIFEAEKEVVADVEEEQAKEMSKKEMSKEATTKSKAEEKTSFVEHVHKKATDFQEKLKKMDSIRSGSKQGMTKSMQIAKDAAFVKTEQEIVGSADVLLENIHASPSIRKFARELGVNLAGVIGTGKKNRITEADVKGYVKGILTSGSPVGAGSVAGGIAGSDFNIAPMPKVDHSQFGEIEVKPLSRIKKLSGAFLHRNWVQVPHVTQFDEADITELEAFRKVQKEVAAKHGIRLTPLVFLMKAVVAGLKQFPTFNASLDASNENLIYKRYFHIAVAVDTPDGLVVPVVRDVDKKGLFELGKELGEISQKARDGKLKAEEMQGSCFTISSLGGIGGTAFTPIVNVPDVAILGVSRSQMKPVYIKDKFEPRLMLPLSLSYNHRVIDGAEAVRFTTFLVQQLSDIRRLLL